MDSNETPDHSISGQALTMNTLNVVPTLAYKKVRPSSCIEWRATLWLPQQRDRGNEPTNRLYKNHMVTILVSVET